jgi:thiamine pyrophosphokinase
MRLVDYITKFSQEKTITLVGPFYKTGDLIEPVIFIDAGAKHQTLGVGFSVGDNDSFAGVLQQQIPREKDLSDLAYALHMVPKSFQTIRLLGFLGGRRDHEFATILEALSFANEKLFMGELIWDDGSIRCIKGSHDYKYRGVFSVFSFFENTEISISGNVKYNVSKQIKAYSSHGLSNEASGQFTVKTNHPVLLYFV